MSPCVGKLSRKVSYHIVTLSALKFSMQSERLTLFAYSFNFFFFERFISWLTYSIKLESLIRFIMWVFILVSEWWYWSYLQFTTRMSGMCATSVSVLHQERSARMRDVSARREPEHTASKWNTATVETSTDVTAPQTFSCHS